MSVVAVKVNKTNIEVAADSIVVRGDSKRTDHEFHKLEKINDIIVGAVGDAQEASLFMMFCQTHNIAAATTKDILEFMVEFIGWQAGMMGMMEDPRLHNEYIIIYDGKAFDIENFFVEEITNYAAIGAGEDFATAALYLGHSACEAVKVACDLSCFVAEPIIEFKVSTK